jgi:hypothetical protein
LLLQFANLVRQLVGPFGFVTSNNGFEVNDETHVVPVLPHFVIHETTLLASPAYPGYPNITAVIFSDDRPEIPDFAKIPFT